MADSTKEEGGKKQEQKKKKNPKIKTEKVREIFQVKTHLVKKASRNVNELSLKKLMTNL